MIIITTIIIIITTTTVKVGRIFNNAFVVTTRQMFLNVFIDLDYTFESYSTRG